MMRRVSVFYFSFFLFGKISDDLSSEYMVKSIEYFYIVR